MYESVEKLSDIIEPSAGQTVYCSEEDKVYRFDPVAGWENIPFDGAELKLGLYDMNKQLLGQLKALTTDELKNKKKLVRDFIKRTKNRHYLMFCKDVGYFTLFQLDIYENCADKLEDVMIDECLAGLGAIKAIDLTEDEGAIEIWISNPDADQTMVLYFFPYDAGVVLCV